MADSFSFREGTVDAGVYRCVVECNEYELPERLPPGTVVIDIGAHIGSFARAALDRGAAAVFAFEADPDNYRLAASNLAPYGRRVQLRNQAVWRSDQPVESLLLRDCPEPSNTGWREVFAESGGRSVPAVPFDRVVDEAAGRGGRIGLLKIDCEGSEFPILLTSRRLHKVDRIVGEFHEFASENYSEPIPAVARVDGYNRYTMAELTPVLERAGFQVRVRPIPNSRLGLFFAERQPAAWRRSLRVLSSALRRLNAGRASAPRPERPAVVGAGTGSC